MADVAISRARRRYPSSPGLQGAYLKGVRSARAGRSMDSCPYAVRKGGKRAQGWSRVWRAAWVEGFLSGR